MEKPKRPRKETSKPAEPVAKEEPKKLQKPSIDPDVREKQIIRLAYDAAEKQLREGTASAAVITHFLKLGGKREYLEQEILERQKTLIEAKAESINKDRAGEEKMQAAIDAMKQYRPSGE